MGRKVFRRMALLRSGQHKVKTDRAAERFGIAIRQHAVIKPGREENQQANLRSQVPALCVERVFVGNGPTMASGKPWHQFIALQWGMNTKHTLLT